MELEKLMTSTDVSLIFHLFFILVTELILIENNVYQLIL